MTSLPASSDFTGAGITEAQFKTAISDLRTFLADLLGTDGLSATAMTALGAILNSTSAKSAAYTVVAGDKGKLIDYTSGTYTLTLTAAATLGAGFSFAVRNSGAGVITIDPNSTELIDGATTITLAAGDSCFVLCSGTAFKTVSKTPTLTSTAINTALGYTAANAAHNHSGTYKTIDSNFGVGCVAMVYAIGGYVAAGSTKAGSYMYPAYYASGVIAGHEYSALSGTWRAMGQCDNGDYGLFERIS